MVEQDFLICQAVAAIFEDKFLKSQVAMRGGTVLHKAHLAPASRYSEDIDLVLVGERPAGHIKKALTRVLKPLLGAPAESIFTDIRLTVRNLVAKSTIIRSTYTYDPASNDAALAHLKVEVNTNERKSLFPLVPVQVQVPEAGGGVRNIEVVSYDLDEMLGTKLRALLQREHGRDLYDIVRAWEVAQIPGSISKVDPARVGQAFHFYMEQEGSALDAEKIKAELARRMMSQKFLNDMNGYLAAGTTYSPQVAHLQFCQVFLPHL
ncbi:MAG: nucleotidyl transferase AbiEii/AbiGii toxin family protein [Gammaproteobacteria bacterium]